MPYNNLRTEGAGPPKTAPDLRPGKNPVQVRAPAEGWPPHTLGVGVDNRTTVSYISAMHAVAELPGFVAAVDDAGLSDDDRAQIIDRLAARPDMGDVIRGTGGARKVRFAGRGKGKRGGYRVITFYTGPDLPLFLITLFSKGEKLNLSQAERNAMRRELVGLAEDYRRGVMRHVRSG